MPPLFLLTILPVLHMWHLLPLLGWLDGELPIAPNLPARAGGWGQVPGSSSPWEVSPFCTSPAALPGQCTPRGDQRWVQCLDTAGSLRGAAGAVGHRFCHNHAKAKDADLRPSSSPRTQQGRSSGHGHGGCRGLGAFPGSQQQDQSPARLAASPAGTSCPAQ